MVEKYFSNYNQILKKLTYCFRTIIVYNICFSFSTREEIGWNGILDYHLIFSMLASRISHQVSTSNSGAFIATDSHDFKLDTSSQRRYQSLVEFKIQEGAPCCHKEVVREKK